MNQILILTSLCASIFLWMACTTDHNQSKNPILSDALHAVDNNPQEVLARLENLSPEHLYDNDKDQYMQFVVILTQARYMCYQDITGDSLILDAQRYFVRNGNQEMAARASFYAAAYWHEGEASDKAVEYWQAAFSFAEQAGSNLFMAKSAHWIGSSYYIQEQWVDAMPYCQKALTLCDDLPDAGYQKLDITNTLGQCYRNLQDPEQAYRYFEDGLKAAINLNNTIFESCFLRNKGRIHLDKGEYRQAKAYFDLALSKQSETEDILRIYLSYAELYRAMNLPDSTLYCLNLVKDRIREITYPNTRRDLYLELAAYYEENGGSASEIRTYLKLAYTEDLRIKKSQNEKKLEAITQRFEQEKQKKHEEAQMYRRMFDYSLIVILILGSLMVIILVSKHWIKEKYNKNREVMFFQTLDQQRFLMAGLRNVAKSADELYQQELAYAGSPVWELQLELLEEICTLIAGYAKTKLEKQQNGRKALLRLTPDDLTIMHLSRMRFSDEHLTWTLGRKENMEEPIPHRKERIRQILTESGMRKKDIALYYPQKSGNTGCIPPS